MLILLKALMKEAVNRERIQKYLSNQLSLEERVRFQETVESDSELKAEFIRQKNIWALAESLGQVGNGPKSNESTRFLFQLEKKKEEAVRSRRLVSRIRFYKVAAMVAVIMLLGSVGMLLMDKAGKVTEQTVLFTESYVPKGEKSELILPDGTHVMINADTHVKIPANFSAKNRKIWLEGQAYFKVKSDSLNPFLLETPRINVEVLGTEFDMSCYPEEEEVTVVLEEGKVMFSGTNNTTIDGKVLKPGETGVYNILNGTLKVEETKNTLYVTGWKSGVFRFKNMPFGELIKKLERQYNVVIDVQDKELLNERYTGEVNSETVRRVMQNFALATPFDVTFNGRYITVKKRKNFK